MLKIIVSKTEDAKSLLKKIEAAKSSAITLVIPKDSRFGDEVANYHALREVATEMDKEIYIESVDEDVLALAKANGWEAIHPLFQGSRKGSISDIVSSKQTAKTLQHSPKHLNEADEVDAHSEEKEDNKNVFHVGVKDSVENSEDTTSEGEQDTGSMGMRDKIHSRESQEEGGSEKKLSGYKIFVSLAILLVIFGGIYYLGAKVFNRGEVTVQFKRDPWEKTLSITASSASNKIDSFSQIIPAQIFIQPKNITQFFPATSRKVVSEKATGKLTIYNSYSSQAQPLVAKTRFATADGKVFRLDSQVIVPGADIKDGKIIASSIITTVTADQPGAEYNLGPVDKLSVLGFKGTPKFDAFYGSILGGTSGGFSGEKAVPSDKDIADAKAKVSELLKSSFDSVIFQGIPKEFTIIDGASDFQITKISVNTGTDDKGQFSVLGEAKLIAVGFKEEDLKTIVGEISAKEAGRGGTKLENPEISYSNVVADYAKGTLKFTVGVKGNTVQDFDGNKFRGEIAGKTENEVRSLFSKLTDLASAKLKISPFWIGRMPADERKIKVVIE